MSQRHNPSSAKQFAQEQSRGYGVSSSQEYEAPRQRAQSQSKQNMGSAQILFSNESIAQERGTPNPLKKETTGTYYGGAVGEQ
jgi:hypothetical protein